MLLMEAEMLQRAIAAHSLCWFHSVSRFSTFILLTLFSLTGCKSRLPELIFVCLVLQVVFLCMHGEISCGMFADLTPLKVIKCAASQAYKNNLSCRINYTSFNHRWAPMAASCGVKLLEPSSLKWSCRECLSSDWASMTKCCLKSQAVSNRQPFSEAAVPVLHL